MRYIKLTYLNSTLNDQLTNGFFRFDDLPSILLRKNRCIECHLPFQSNVNPNLIIDHFFKSHTSNYEILYFWYSKDIHSDGKHEDKHDVKHEDQNVDKNEDRNEDKNDNKKKDENEENSKIDNLEKSLLHQFNEELEIPQCSVEDKIRNQIRSKVITLPINNLDCTVCGSKIGKKTSNHSKNCLIICDGLNGKCPVIVHQLCYDIADLPEHNWFCAKCSSTNRESIICCELCPHQGITFKKTIDNKFVHAICGLMIHGIEYDESTDLLNLANISTRNWKANCSLCIEEKRIYESKIGACIKCNSDGCLNYCHAICAQRKGFLCEFRKTHFVLFCCAQHKPSKDRSYVRMVSYYPKITESSNQFKILLNKLHPNVDTNTNTINKQSIYIKQNSKEKSSNNPMIKDQSNSTKQDSDQSSSSKQIGCSTVNFFHGSYAKKLTQSKMNQTLSSNDKKIDLNEKSNKNCESNQDYAPIRLVRTSLRHLRPRSTNFSYCESINRNRIRESSTKTKELNKILPFFTIDDSSTNENISSNDNLSIKNKNKLMNNQIKLMNNQIKLPNNSSISSKNQILSTNSFVSFKNEIPSTQTNANNNPVNYQLPSIFNQTPIQNYLPSTYDPFLTSSKFELSKLDQIPTQVQSTYDQLLKSLESEQSELEQIPPQVLDLIFNEPHVQNFETQNYSQSTYAEPFNYGPMQTQYQPQSSNLSTYNQPQLIQSNYNQPQYIQSTYNQPQLIQSNYNQQQFMQSNYTQSQCTQSSNYSQPQSIQSSNYNQMPQSTLSSNYYNNQISFQNKELLVDYSTSSQNKVTSTYVPMSNENHNLPTFNEFDSQSTKISSFNQQETEDFEHVVLITDYVRRKNLDDSADESLADDETPKRRYLTAEDLVVIYDD